MLDKFQSDVANSIVQYLPIEGQLSFHCYDNGFNCFRGLQRPLEINSSFNSYSISPTNKQQYVLFTIPITKDHMFIMFCNGDSKLLARDLANLQMYSESMDHIHSGNCIKADNWYIKQFGWSDYLIAPVDFSGHPLPEFLEIQNRKVQVNLIFPISTSEKNLTKEKGIDGLLELFMLHKRDISNVTGLY
ncbi:MAG: hypothetical protein HRU38_15560 [Saccharospirillaceae bacterium]|nr:hypothetical protein [Pseudomonadales bacterium]NRB80058.1 hypothetical protein [Saccharospirillaceae bacterium]